MIVNKQLQSHDDKRKNHRAFPQVGIFRIDYVKTH